jgi:hypothetical protein
MAEHLSLTTIRGACRATQNKAYRQNALDKKFAPQPSQGLDFKGVVSSQSLSCVNALCIRMQKWLQSYANLPNI